MTNDLALEVKNLQKHYFQGDTLVKALDGVDLQIHHREFVAIMGRSGSGKSTLLNMLGGLDRPSSGEVLLDGQDIATLPSRKLVKVRRNKIGFVFQQFNLIPTLTALENVEMPLHYAGISGKKRGALAKKALEEVSLGHRTSHRPNQMSGGESQRTAIARALVNKPSIILADEPTGEVDSHTAESIIDLMKKLNRELGATFIIVTHDPAVASHTNRIIRLSDGKIESDEPVKRN